VANKVTWIFLARDQYSAIAKQVSSATSGIRDKFAAAAAAAKQAADQTTTLADRMRKSGADMRKIGRDISLYVSAPATLFAATAIRSYDQQAVALAKVESAVRSTGGAAKLSVQELAAEADKLQASTIFGDEAILNDVTTTLLGFGKIAGETFKRTQSAAADMATRTGGDLRSASLALGKALDDPLTGLDGLRRAGITFTKDEKALIQALAQANMTAQAQALILKKVETGVGGMAQAAAKAGLGPLRQLGNAFDDLRENIGKVLLDLLSPLIASLRGMVEWMKNLSPTTTKVIAGIVILAAVLGPLLIVIGSLIAIKAALIATFVGIGAAITFATGPIGLAIIAVSALVAAAIWLYNEFKPVRDIVGLLTMAFAGWWEILKLVFSGLQAIAAPVLGAVTDAFSALSDALSGTLEIVSGIYESVVGIMSAMKGAVQMAAEETAAYVEFGGNIQTAAATTTDINVNLRAPKGAVESVKTRTNGRAPGMNVGVNMVALGITP
jgi:hypothetical protein